MLRRAAGTDAHHSREAIMPLLSALLIATVCACAGTLSPYARASAGHIVFVGAFANDAAIMVPAWMFDRAVCFLA
ncbi:MAG: hypothetical protein RL701_5554 [Pseudomonadota bacterium]|jgi:hypothetical protein